MYVIIPMAGKGSRFAKAGISIPKPLIEVDGMTLAEHSITTLGIEGTYVFITRDFENPDDNQRLTDIFTKTCKNFIEIRVNDEQLGAAHSANYAEHFIPDDEQLIVTNCDQHLEWDSKHFLDFIERKDPDGVVVLYQSSNPKNSFAVVEDNAVVRAIAEKQPISEDALIGVHYWKHAKDFFSSTRRAIRDYEEQGYPECYVSITYNYLIHDGKDIRGYWVFDNDYTSLGTPKDLEEYEQRNW